MKKIYINKEKLILLSLILLSCILIIIGSAFPKWRIITLIGLVTFLLFDFGLNIGILFLRFNQEKYINLPKKFTTLMYFSFLAIPISFILITISSILLTIIPNFSLANFYNIYFYFYFFPIIFIILNFLIFLSFYKQERKIDNSNTNTEANKKLKVTNIIIFNHNDCSICLKNSKI